MQLYCDYTIPPGTLIRNFLISFHRYADDSQLYKSVIQLQNCISEISDWMNRNKLKFNEDKTEFLIAGTSQQHAKVLFDCLRISGTIMQASPCVKNLGIIIDEELTLNNYIIYIYKS